MNKLKAYYITHLHKFINYINRKKLKNKTPTLIASNCTGGFLYHWLGLKFQSPFINLWMTNEDFIIALENFKEFIDTPLEEYRDFDKDYPVGVGYKNTKIYFQHYKDWGEANRKWKKGKKELT